MSQEEYDTSVDDADMIQVLEEVLEPLTRTFRECDEIKGAHREAARHTIKCAITFYIQNIVLV